MRRYFPCTVDWFLARCEVLEVRRGWRRRVLRVLEHAGALTGAALQVRAAESWTWRVRVCGSQGHSKENLTRPGVERCGVSGGAHDVSAVGSKRVLQCSAGRHSTAGRGPDRTRLLLTGHAAAL